MLLLGCGKEEREIRGWVGNPLQRVGLLNGFEVGRRRRRKKHRRLIRWSETDNSEWEWGALHSVRCGGVVGEGDNRTILLTPLLSYSHNAIRIKVPFKGKRGSF